MFTQHIGIDYSGAETPTSRMKSLQVYASIDGDVEKQTTPAAPAGKHWNWTRKEIADWLIDQINQGDPLIIGIDHGFSFPLSYFQQYPPTTWDEFLVDFCQHWPTYQEHTYVDFIRDENPDRTGEPIELRLTEQWTSSAKSVFRFDVQGQVAKSTHAGIPWLHRIRQKCGDRVHFWPFDGWHPVEGKTVVAEVYPSIFRNRYERDGRTSDEQDAYSVARWLQEADQNEFLDRYFEPALTGAERKVASLEGWILGIA